jgi:hypothetical protein
MAAELVALASRKPDRRTASRDVAMELRAERHEDHEFARAMYALGSRLFHLIVADLEPEALQRRARSSPSVSVVSVRRTPTEGRRHECTTTPVVRHGMAPVADPRGPLP